MPTAEVAIAIRQDSRVGGRHRARHLRRDRFHDAVVRCRRNEIAHRGQRLQIASYGTGIVAAQSVKVHPGHAPEIQRPVGRAAVPQRIHGLLFGPIADAGTAVGGEITGDEDALWIRDHAHAAGKIEVIAAIDAGAIDLRVA